jgi:hypothetical protein
MQTVYVVDRIEEGAWVVLEDLNGTTFEVPRSWFAGRLREGDVVRVTVTPGEEGSGQSQLLLELDEEERKRRLAAAADARARLPRGPSGDIQL